MLPSPPAPVTAGPGALWRAFARPARRCRVGDRLRFGGDFEAEVLAKGEAGEITLAFGCAPGRCSSGSSCGHMPLPPYIRRPPEGRCAGPRDYQTMFAARAGAVPRPRQRSTSRRA